MQHFTRSRNPTWRKQRSALERGLIFVAVSGVLLCIAGIVGTDEALGPPVKDVHIVSTQGCEKTVCSHRECFHIASTVLKNMDLKVKPCDNFYQFACGGFLKSTIIPNNQNNANAFTDIADLLREQLRASIEGSSNRRPFRLVKNLYKSCMNKTAIENEGSKPLLKILKKFGGWPVLDGETWNEIDFDWIKLIYKFRETGYSVDYLFCFKVIVDRHIKTKRVISLEPANLGLNYKHLSEGVNNEQVKAYYNYMVDIAVLLGAERKRASTELMKSLLFEINLANISQSIEEQIHARLSYNPITLDVLTKKYSSIPWREYFRKLLPKTITVEKNEIAILNMPSFISDLETLLLKTPKRVQANYLIWRAVKASISYLNDDLRKRQFEYSTVWSGKNINISRTLECVRLVSARLPVALRATHVRKYFNKEAKQSVVDIVMNIKNQFYKMLQQAEWMDEKTRRSALERAAAMTIYVAYPDELLDDKKLGKFYENLELSGGNYLESYLNSTFFYIEHSFSKLREPVNKSNWVDQVHLSNIIPSYQWGPHSIHLPVGFLQGAFFSNDRPKYMNYASIGTVIGHEMTHGFDWMEYLFNDDENLSNWTLTKKNYLNKVDCIINQYGNYTVEEVGLQLNAVRTRNNDIADNVGIRTAYLAYIDWVKKNKPDQKLPGLPYSQNQMFWISAANALCEKWKPNGLKNSMKKETHSPGKFRILGSLSNMPEFSKDFDCPIGSQMNPEEKCSVW